MLEPRQQEAPGHIQGMNPATDLNGNLTLWMTVIVRNLGHWRVQTSSARVAAAMIKALNMWLAGT